MSDAPPLRRDFTAYAEAVIWALLLGYAVYHGRQIALTAVDVPRADEWNLIDGLSPEFSLSWIFAPHNQHRIVPSKLWTWILYRADGWNIAHQQVLNFVLFCTLCPLIYLFGRDLRGGSFWMLPAFLFFLLTPLTYENHSWSFQSCFHFVLIFTVAAVYVGIARFELASHRLAALALFVFCIVAALYSLSSAAGSVFAVSIAFAALLVIRYGLNVRSAAGWFALGVILFAVYIWTFGLVRPQGSTSIAEYSTFFLNLVSLGHGYTFTHSLWPGAVVLVLYAAPSVVLLLDPHQRKSNAVIACITLGAALLAGLAIIAIGRAVDSPGNIDHAKFSRYSELSAPLIPIIAILWWQALAAYRRLRVLAMAIYWVACFAAFRDDLSFENYWHIHRDRLNQIACFGRQVHGGQPCSDFGTPEFYTPRLERAKTLDLSFTRSEY